MSKLNNILSEQNAISSQWQEPEIFKLDDSKDVVNLEKRIAEGNVGKVYDPLKSIADGMFELNYPNKSEDTSARAEFVDSIMQQGDEYGSWVLYPWTGELVHFPDQQDYRDLRTYRFRNLLTKEELDGPLKMARLAVFGMSVGSNIAVSSVRNGLGEAIALGDMASPSVSNIGRAEFDMRDLSAQKIDATAKKISYIDPFVKQTHFREGVHSGMLDQLTAFNPTIIGDEIDHMPSSAILRAYSAHQKLPYVSVSDVHDAAILEICRHDLNENTPLYAGRVSDDQAVKLMKNEFNIKQQEDIFVRSVGYRNLTPGIIESGIEVGDTLSGIPQLGSTAVAGAGLAVVAYREILLGNNNVKTGMKSMSIAKAVGKNIKLSEVAHAVASYSKYMRKDN